MDWGRARDVVATTTAAVMGLLVVSAIAQAQAIGRDVPSGSFMQVATQGLATPIIPAFGLAAVLAAHSGGRDVRSVVVAWFTTIGSAVVALGSVLRTVYVLGVDVFGSGQSFLGRPEGPAARTAAVAVTVATVILAIGTLGVARDIVAVPSVDLPPEEFEER